MSSQLEASYEFGPFRLDVAERRLLKDGETVPLTPKAFETLLALVRKSRRLVCRDELMKEVWPRGSVEEGNLSHHVYLLRKALGRDADGNLYIETVPKHGYRLVANVSVPHTDSAVLVGEDKEERAEGPQAQEVESKALLPAAPTFSRTRSVLTFSCVLLICAVLGSSWWTENRKAARGPHTKSIAVLPFKPIAVESSSDHLELGVTAATIKKLSTLRQIAVRPASAVITYADRKDDSLTVGRRLGVDAVLEGVVQRSGDEVRVTVQLINVADGQSLWAQKFDARCTDILVIQDAISEQLAQALKQELAGDDKNEVALRETENPAHDMTEFDPASDTQTSPKTASASPQ